MSQTKQQKSSFLDCCTCGDQDKNKQIYVDVTEKKPVSTIPLFSTPQVVSTQTKQVKTLNKAPPPTNSTEIVTKPILRPASVQLAPRSSIIRTLVKPKIIFNYITPGTVLVNKHQRMSQNFKKSDPIMQKEN